MPMSLMLVCFPSIIARIVSPSMTLETVVAYECCGTNAGSVCQFFEPEVDGASGGSDRPSDWLLSSELPQAPKEAAKSAVANSTMAGGRVFIADWGFVACLWVGSFLCCLIPLSTWGDKHSCVKFR